MYNIISYTYVHLLVLLSYLCFVVCNGTIFVIFRPLCFYSIDAPDSGTSLDYTDAQFQSQSALSFFRSSTLTTEQYCLFPVIILAFAKHKHRHTSLDA